MSKEIITKIEVEKNDDMKTNEIIDALDRIQTDRDALQGKGVDPAEIDAVMSALGTQLTAKVSGAIGIMQKYSDLALAADTRLKSLQDLSSRYGRRVEMIREYIKYAMGASGTKKIEAENYSVTYSRVEKGSVDIFDAEQLPPEFIKTKTVESVDRVAIGEKLKRGEDVPGARMLPSERLLIKGV